VHASGHGTPTDRHVSLLVAEPVERNTVSDASSETRFLACSGEVLDCLEYERLRRTSTG